MENIERAIDSLVYPTDTDYSLTLGDTSIWTIDIPVQNLTTSSATLYPSISTSSTQISITSSDCDGVILEPGQSCAVTLTVDSSVDPLTSNIAATLSLNDNDNTDIEINIATVSSGSDSGSSSDDTTSGGASGGSVNILMMLALGGIAYTRRKRE